MQGLLHNLRDGNGLGLCPDPAQYYYTKSERELPHSNKIILKLWRTCEEKSPDGGTIWALDRMSYIPREMPLNARPTVSVLDQPAVLNTVVPTKRYSPNCLLTLSVSEAKPSAV